MREPCMMRMGAMLRGEISSLFAVGGARWGLLSIEWRIPGHPRRGSSAYSNIDRLDNRHRHNNNITINERGWSAQYCNLQR